MIGDAKIVLNGAIDIAGNDRGNMRCFEAMGCGALLLSDDGIYPEGMKDGDTMFTYKSPHQAAELALRILAKKIDGSVVAARGRKMVDYRYNKTLQWERFVEIISLPKKAACIPEKSCSGKIGDRRGGIAIVLAARPPPWSAGYHTSQRYAIETAIDRRAIIPGKTPSGWLRYCRG